MAQQTLNYFPGQLATIWLQTLDGYGTRFDPSCPPMVTRIIFPSFTLACGYPKHMRRVDVGLYYATFVLPSGGAAVGNYLVDTAWQVDGYCDGYDGYLVYNEAFQIIVQAPFGNFATNTFEHHDHEFHDFEEPHREHRDRHNHHGHHEEPWEHHNHEEHHDHNRFPEHHDNHFDDHREHYDNHFDDHGEHRKSFERRDFHRGNRRP
jgi:hypothetical protein